MKSILESMKPKHIWDWKYKKMVFWPANCLEWWSAVAYVRYRLISVWWVNWKKDSRLPVTNYILKNDWNLSPRELHRGTLQHKACLDFNYTMGAMVAWSVISRDSQPLSNFNDMSMTRGVVSSNDIAFWWCQKVASSGKHTNDIHDCASGNSHANIHKLEEKKI